MTQTSSQNPEITSNIMLAIAGQIAATSDAAFSTPVIARLLVQNNPARKTGLSFIAASEAHIVTAMNAAALALYGHNPLLLPPAIMAINAWVSSSFHRVGALPNGTQGEQLINWSYNTRNTQADFAQAKAAAAK